MEITIAGTDYIGGRDDGVVAMPYRGTALHGVTPVCADGNVPSQPVVAHTIPGVSVADAVVGPDGHVLLAEHLWQQPWAAFPLALQPYVRQ